MRFFVSVRTLKSTSFTANEGMIREAIATPRRPRRFTTPKPRRDTCRTTERSALEALLGELNRITSSVNVMVTPTARSSTKSRRKLRRVARSRRVRATRRSFRRLFVDDRAVGVTITLTDEVMRFNSPRSASSALRSVVRHVSRRGFGVVNLLGLRGVAMASRIMPSLAVKLVDFRVRTLTKNLILDAAPRELQSQIREHQRAGLLLNVNVLGEAVLGEVEADDRFARVLEMVRRDDVNYVSVKLSAIASQLLTIDHEGSVARVLSLIHISEPTRQAEISYA